jgi:hypothetical protein
VYSFPMQLERILIQKWIRHRLCYRSYCASGAGLSLSTMSLSIISLIW